ncbi:hypothetical protein DL89DRAFT_256506 [Linderina pennispora]|uniref:Uncharacterized protein n=1 Tax=Linderina pennispora TaxID=61395 RepID=A0A1Y1WD92_9FUNG|nr:uncharacterized protein DL89DRAFT_256506 [Linderina pennispora]ORX71500.1 hypothetical protein DL89DRAFT_256506 [Linderina pennispora]
MSVPPVSASSRVCDAVCSAYTTAAIRRPNDTTAALHLLLPVSQHQRLLASPHALHLLQSSMAIQEAVLWDSDVAQPDKENLDQLSAQAELSYEVEKDAFRNIEAAQRALREAIAIMRRRLELYEVEGRIRELCLRAATSYQDTLRIARASHYLYKAAAFRRLADILPQSGMPANADQGGINRTRKGKEVADEHRAVKVASLTGMPDSGTYTLQPLAILALAKGKSTTTDCDRPIIRPPAPHSGSRRAGVDNYPDYMDYESPLDTNQPRPAALDLSVIDSNTLPPFC